MQIIRGQNKKVHTLDFIIIRYDIIKDCHRD
jgi:hypothetical protein